MIHFTYNHVTQNNKLEEYCNNRINDLINCNPSKIHCQMTLFRKFNERNVVKEVVEIDLSVEGGIKYISTGVESNFRKSTDFVFNQLEEQLSHLNVNEQEKISA